MLETNNVTGTTLNPILPASSSETAEFEITRHGIATVVDDHATSEIGAHSDLLGLLLSQQKSLSAVEMFSYLYDEPCLLPPSQDRYYKTLLPTTKPGLNQQYAFQVNLDRCSGCKACVAACHTLNGLEESETWRDVGVLHQKEAEQSFLQHVTSACHHCIDPACLKGCPTNAYEKDPLTGIVYHLDDQCFGCQYCTLACPYGVPKYSDSKGIVRKCDMCRQRLAVNEAPACVQACPHEAISISVVDVDDILADAASNVFLPRTHDASYTKPTTRYLSKKPLPRDLTTGDDDDIQPEHAHLPLILMLVLMQASLGGYLAATGLCFVGGFEFSQVSIIGLLILSFLLGQAGLVAATLHLGRPLYAFRGILGIRHSWLSREAVAFGGYAVFTGLAAFLAGYQTIEASVESLLPGVASLLTGSFLRTGLLGSLLGSVTFGILGTFCSVMVYVFTQRSLWSFHRTNMRFFGTAVVTGLSLVLTILVSEPELSSIAVRVISLLLMILAGSKILGEFALLWHLKDAQLTDDKKTSLLLTGALRSTVVFRIACGVIGGIVFPTLIGMGVGSVPISLLTGVAVVGCLFVIAGELAERTLFFQAVIAPRMPGGMR